MFKNFQHGDRLIVQLNNKDILYGDFVKSTENRLDLKNISDQDNREIGGILSFYINEVISVRLLCKKRREEPEGSGLNCINHNTESCSSAVSKVLLDEEEFERLNQLVQNNVFLHQKDDTYFKSCSELLSVESIGVVGLGCSAGRDARLSLLVLTTWYCVYIFDLSECPSRSMHKELKEILESSYTQKTVHDGRALIDCLYHSHCVKMSNVFDTLIADVTLKKRENDKYDGKLLNISECLIEYLNFPEYLLYGAVSVSDNEWTVRPLEHEFRIKAALLGVYLLPLKDLLLRKLLKGYFGNVNSVYKMITKSNLCGSDRHINSSTLTPELDALIVPIE